MNYGRLQPTYVSLRTAHNEIEQDTNVNTYTSLSSADDLKYASASITINSNIFKDASQYVVAIERMELPINGIPFYIPDATENIIVYRRTGANTGLTSSNRLNTNSYSLSDLFIYLNQLDFVDRGDDSNFNVTFSINGDGFTQLTLGNGKQFADLLFRFPRKLNMILGISENRQITDAIGNIVYSSFPRIDLGDNLQHIIIESNLPTTSDQIGNAPLNILTDFAPPTAYSNSLKYAANAELEDSAFSTSIRQKVIYNPSERRYLDLISSFAIQNITVTAYYTDIDGNIKRVELPLGGCFDIKLGFYKKV